MGKIKGKLHYLAAGNNCWLTDARRTPGIIEWVDYERAVFRWRILDFEDAGNYWLLPAERVADFLFAEEVESIPSPLLSQLEGAIAELSEPLVVVPKASAFAKTQKEIEAKAQAARSWLICNSSYIGEGTKPNLSSRKGPDALAADLLAYCDHYGIRALEEKTATALVLNPSSGEWIKGMEFVLAQMGLAKFTSTQFRTEGVFSGMGSHENRRNYLLERLGFVRALFRLLDLSQVALYRGMATERPWSYKERNLLSFTFSLEVAQEFADFQKEGKLKHSYLVKTTIPCEELFMTFLETEAMNEQYAEAEALVLTKASGSERTLWW